MPAIYDFRAYAVLTAGLGTSLSSAQAAGCPQLAEGDIPARNEGSGCYQFEHSRAGLAATAGASVQKYSGLPQADALSDKLEVRQTDCAKLAAAGVLLRRHLGREPHARPETPQVHYAAWR